MNDIPVSILFLALLFLILISGFFSGSETGLMSLNRYKLKSLAEQDHGGAKRAERLLQRPERLISLILLGNNFVNILITQVATYLGYRLYGDTGIAIATGLLTLILLIFAEVTPKTIAAMNAEKVAYPAAYVYVPLLRLLSPLVIIINLMTSQILRLLKLHPSGDSRDALNSDELRIAVAEAGALIPDTHRSMLISVLDLEKVHVEDIMVPRNEISGIDLDEDWDETLAQIMRNSYSRVPVYRGSIDQTLGVALMRKITPLILANNLNPDSLQEITREGYYIPEGTSLTAQLINFQKNRRRMGFVVDEYGDIQGLVTLEDILEEIVGEFTTVPTQIGKDHSTGEDGSCIVDGSRHIRSLNRELDLDLPTDGPRTLNGLILEHMEMIPDPSTSLRIGNTVMEILSVNNNRIKSVRIQQLPDPTENG